MEYNKGIKKGDESKNFSNKNKNKRDSFHNIKSSKELDRPLINEKISGIIEQNYIQKQSPFQQSLLFNINFLDDKNSMNNDNSFNRIPNYSPLTPQMIPKDQRPLNKKYFPSKEEVCRGNPDYSQKIKIPSSSPITQYFNMDVNLNKDFGFSLEKPTNSNNFQETPSHLSNSQSDIFNYSPSIFFNKGTNNDAGKNYEEEFNNVENDFEEYKNKNIKDEGEEIFAVKLEDKKIDIKVKEPENIILKKINELKSKKKKDKSKSNNNLKKLKNTKNININEFINKDKNGNVEINKEVQKSKKNQNSTETINNKNFYQSKISDNIIDEKNIDKNPIKIQAIEDVDISPEISKKIVEDLDKYDESPLILNKDYYKDLNSDKTKEMMFDNKNLKNNSNGDNNIQINNNLNNYLENEDTGNDNTKNLNYINGMNINCTNLNINNFTSLNQLDQGNNFLYQNPPFYFQNYNNQNSIYQNNYITQNNNNEINNNYEIKKNQSNIKDINNYQDNIYNKNQNINNINNFNEINTNTYYDLNNNINQGYSYISNDNNMINTPFIQKNFGSTNKKELYNPNLKYNLQNNDKRKKIKKLDTSFYINRPLSYLAQNIELLGKDQAACRYVQKLISENPTNTLRILYEPICDKILQLISDQFGNYLIQKLIVYLNEEQLINILKIITPQFFEICCNNHGTRVLQKFIDCSKTPKVKNYFYFLLKPLITPLLKELKGTFIVQKFAEDNKEYENEISAIIVENSPDLATHRHGCCVIQKYLELKDPTMTPLLLDKLIENSLLLIVDQFGNYVIQTILLMRIKKYGNKLAEQISQNIVYYAKHKYSSNVVEKCFDYCDGIYLNNLMMNVQKKENLRELILDEHGNYVVQKVLRLSEPKTKRVMLKMIISLFDKLKAYPFGERVINKLYITYPMIADKNFMID